MVENTIEKVRMKHQPSIEEAEAPGEENGSSGEETEEDRICRCRMVERKEIR